MNGSTCAWSHHGYKHFAAKSDTRGDTANGNPALYLSSFSARFIETIERTTVSIANWRSGNLPQRTEYLRDAGITIGWDDGKDATLSFAECSGGSHARSVHGRPAHVTNAKAMRLMTGRTT